ncbi:hypothetical protein B0J11DRAFT_598925 [Dendryphion nanum]|uniref:Uncharacterized protein n=1 Tax=Dendryphion nanum TaxID=256645 RepID=A0A9P9D0F1_9PLEO|nr:hypothetical protein B0J11DRAFT_598925 [Dendryphion nanum]
MSLNPLELTDLECLKIWQGQNRFKKSGRNGFELQYRPISNAEIPSGYALDRYGLLVCEEFGSPQEKICDGKAQSASFDVGKRDWKYQRSPAPLHIQCSSQVYRPEAREEANTLIDEDWIQSTLLRNISHSCPSSPIPRTQSRQSSTPYEEQQSSQSASKSRPVHGAKRTAEDIEFEDMMCLMDRNMTQTKSEDQDISNQMAQMSDQRDLLGMQLPREADRFSEPSALHTKQQLRDLDEKWTQWNTKRSSLREDFKRRCLIFLKGTK